jgi:hypothetical protein
MSYKESCKGCSVSVKVASDSISNMIDEIVSSGNFRIVSEEIYSRRLESCSDCIHLNYNTTCMQCGCIVQVRALLEEKNCPHPQKSRW